MSSAERACLVRLAALQAIVGMLVGVTSLADVSISPEIRGALLGAALAIAVAGLVLVGPLARRGQSKQALAHLLTSGAPDPADLRPLAEPDVRAAASMLGIDWIALLVPEQGVRRHVAWAELHVLQRGKYRRHRVPLGSSDPGENEVLGFAPPPGVHLPRPPHVKRLQGQSGELGRIIVADAAAARSATDPHAAGTPQTLLALLGAWWSMRLDNRKLAADAEARLLDIVESLITSVEAKDPYTSGHSKRVCRYSELVAMEMGIRGRELEEIAIGAALHDVGKLGIPEQVLRKPTKLDDEEWQLMRSHPKVGARIIDSFNQSPAVLHMIYHHHEHWNGKGYPSGLSGEAIPLPARIVATADALDAMTSQRSYQRNRTVADAVEELKRSAGRQFDPAVVEAMARIPIEQLEEVAPPAPPAPAELPEVAPGQNRAVPARIPSTTLVPVPAAASVPVVVAI